MSFQGDDEPRADAGQRDNAQLDELVDSHAGPPDSLESADRVSGLSRRFWVIAGASAAIVLSAGAGFAAGSMVGGGGTQPEDVLPATMVMYADVDLDPAAGQKLNLVRLLGRFPDVEDEYGPEPDIRQLLADQLAEGTDLEDADVDRWVGDRVGVGVAWDEDAQALTPVAAIQVTDESAALDDLRIVVDDDQVAAADGYVVVTGDVSELGDIADAGTPLLPSDGAVASQTASEIVDAGEAESLAASSAFTDAFDRLDEGLATFYLDGEGMATAGDYLTPLLGGGEVGASDPFAQLAESGQTAAVLRAEPDAIELVGWSSAEPPGGTAPVSLVGDLPDSTLFALEVTGGAESVAKQWEELRDDAEQDLPAGSFERMLAQLEAQFGVQLPDDLQTLVGDDVLVAVDGEGLLTGVPGIGLRSITDPEAGADLANRLGQTLAVWSGGFGITAQGTEDGMVIASTPEFADQLAEGGGSLGETSEFRAAVPDAEGASQVVWLDFAAVAGFVALAEPEAADVIDPLDSFGASVSADDGGTEVRARLMFSGDE